MKATYNISYGVYILTTKGEKQNGCVINTLLQVTTSPNQISITVNKNNYTTELIQKTGEFNVSIIDLTAGFDLIERFGFSSGRDKDKFEGFLGYKVADNGINVITQNTNSYISAKVVGSFDNGTHITFFAKVTDDVVLADTKPMTYAYYLEKVKPQPKPQNKVVYVCRICGYVYEGDPLPEDFICPLCKHGAIDFERKESNPPVQEQKTKSEKKKYVCPVCGYSVESETAPESCIICGAEMIEEK